MTSFAQPVDLAAGCSQWSAHIPLANEQSVGSSQQYHATMVMGYWSQWSEFRSSKLLSAASNMFEHSFALQDWITEFKCIFQIWHGLQPLLNDIINSNQGNCVNMFGCIGSYKYKNIFKSTSKMSKRLCYPKWIYNFVQWNISLYTCVIINLYNFMSVDLPDYVMASYRFATKYCGICYWQLVIICSNWESLFMFLPGSVAITWRCWLSIILCPN